MDLIALQGMHAHAGVSSVAAALAWSITRSPDSGGRSVFIDGAPSFWGATAIFGIPAAFPSWLSAGNDLKGLLSRAALYDDAVLTLPARPGDPAPDAALARSLMAELNNLAALSRCLAVADAGVRGSPAAKAFAAIADIVFTVTEADAAGETELSSLVPESNEYFLINRLDTRSPASRDSAARLRKHPVIGPRILDAEIPLDEFVREAAMKPEPYTRYLNYSEASCQTERVLLDIRLIRSRTGDPEDRGGKEPA